jgi:hypothetical protein
MFELTRLAISAVVAVALEAVLCMPTAGAAPVSMTDAHSAELSAEAPPNSADPRRASPTTRSREEDSTAVRGAEPFVSDIPATPSVDGLFHSREFELSVTEDDYERYSPRASCVNPDSFLRRLAGGADDCPAIKPGTDESEVFSLPFLAICGWALVVLAVAGLHRFYGVWRVRRWLRRMRAQGLVPSAAALRRVAARRARRARSHGQPQPRRYAG